MKTVDVNEASKSLSDYTYELNDQIIVVTSNHEPIAALVSLKHVDKESLALSTNPDFMELIQSARDEIQAGYMFSLEEMKQSVME